MDISIIKQVKIQARVLVPLVKALQSELGVRAIGLHDVRFQGASSTGRRNTPSEREKIERRR